ncbi:hypothetical protein JTB14_027669 [Gonioctena quinquepunctata]|nr:hypothetical protein JTB14_027669 [Gonioctena quinquepunctata]
MHQNIQSLGNSLSMIQKVIEDLKRQVVCITEQWQTQHNVENYTFKDYNQVSSHCRQEGQVYASKEIVSSPIDEVNVFAEDYVFECSSASCKMCGKKFNVVYIYRSPSSEVELF